MNTDHRPPAALLFIIIMLAGNASFAQISFIDAEFAGAGARALGMGTAFIAMSDDATAAEFNPAGLRYLRRPELAFQGIYTIDRREQFLFESSFPPGAGIEDFQAVTRDFETEYPTPSFVSVVYPTRNFVVSFSQLTSVNQETKLIDEGWYDTSFGGIDEMTHIRNEVLGETVLHNYGFSIATAPHPKFYVGASLRYGELSYEQHRWTRTEIVESGEPVYSDFTETHESDSDWAFNWNVGAIWRAHKQFSFGAVYKSPIPFELEYMGQTIDLDVPSTIGAGVAFHPNDRLRILADWDHAEWSEFDDDPSDSFVRDDVDRYHIGGEYLLGVRWDTAWFARAGYFLEESNALYYTGRTDFVTGRVLAEGVPKGDDVDHLSFGFGLARERFQLDFAADFTSDTKDFVVSTVVYF